MSRRELMRGQEVDINSRAPKLTCAWLGRGVRAEGSNKPRMTNRLGIMLEQNLKFRHSRPSTLECGWSQDLFVLLDQLL